MHDDHKPVALQMQWHECHAATPTQGRQRQGYKAARYQHHPEMRNQILGISELCWHNDVEQQTACITKHLHDVLGSTATPGSLCKKFYITEKAWQIRTDKIQYKKKIKETQRMLNRALLQCCFGAWTQHSQPRSEHVDLIEAFQYGISLRCTLLGLVARLRSAGLQLRQELIVNKKQALAACIAQLPPEASANDFLKQLKPFIGPTNPKKAKTKTMPVLNNEHGVRCQFPCEAQGIWIDFSRTWRLVNACLIQRSEEHGSPSSKSSNKQRLMSRSVSSPVYWTWRKRSDVSPEAEQAALMDCRESYAIISRQPLLDCCTQAC